MRRVGGPGDLVRLLLSACLLTFAVWTFKEIVTEGGLFTNPSDDGFQGADAANLIVAIAALIVGALTPALPLIEDRHREAEDRRRELEEVGREPEPAELDRGHWFGEPGLAATLRVHQAIPLAGTPAVLGVDAYLPAWVERDLAEDVREWLPGRHGRRRTRGRGELVGGQVPAVLYETAAKVLEGWRVIPTVLGDDGLSL